MPRTLDDIVADYGKLDEQAKLLKKEVDTEKDLIKSMMCESNLTEYTAGGFTVKYSVSERTTVDEVKMLNVLKQDWVERFGSMECPYIKTIEVIDEDALESALYKGDIPENVMAELNNCQEVTEVVKLTCGRQKKKKTEDTIE